MAKEVPVTESAIHFDDKTVVILVVLFVMGALARQLIKEEPVKTKVLAGEMILSAISAITIHSLGLMQGMTDAQIFFFGSLGALGGWRMISWVIRIIKDSKIS